MDRLLILEMFVAVAGEGGFAAAARKIGRSKALLSKYVRELEDELGALLLNRTAYGRYVQAIGSNEQVARYAAVDVDRTKVLTYTLLGVCVGIATLLYVPRLGSASPSTGLLWELEAIAAVIVGGTALKGGQGRIVGTVVGAVLLSVIGNILNLTSIISVYLNAAVQGFVIIVVAFLQRGRR